MRQDVRPILSNFSYPAGYESDSISIRNQVAIVTSTYIGKLAQHGDGRTQSEADRPDQEEPRRNVGSFFLEEENASDDEHQRCEEVHDRRA